MSESKDAIEVFKREIRAAKKWPLSNPPRNELEKYVFFYSSAWQPLLSKGQCMVRLSSSKDPTILSCSWKINNNSFISKRMKWITRCDEGHGVWTFISSDTGESDNTFISKLEHLPDYLKLYYCLDVELIAFRRKPITPHYTAAETIRL